jgi:hypothetical protein
MSSRRAAPRTLRARRRPWPTRPADAPRCTCLRETLPTRTTSARQNERAQNTTPRRHTGGPSRGPLLVTFQAGPITWSRWRTAERACTKTTASLHHHRTMVATRCFLTPSCCFSSPMSLHILHNHHPRPRSAGASRKQRQSSYLRSKPGRHTNPVVLMLQPSTTPAHNTSGSRTH